MRIDRRFISAGIFLGAILVLIFYLLALRYQVAFPTQLFFISLALIVGSLLYQIFAVDLKGGFSGVVIFEITLAALAFHFIYQIPTYGLYGSDAYYDTASMKAILESGHVAGVREYVQITSFFPMMHIAGAEMSLITGIDYFNTAKWLPAVIGGITIPMIYLFVRHVFEQERAALLAALLYATLQHYVMFGSLFVRETIAIVMAISCVYFYRTAGSSQHTLVYRGLSLLFLAGTILAHHLTSVMLLLLLLFYWGFTSFARPPARSEIRTDETERGVLSLSFLLIGVVGTLAYWLTTVVEPVQIGMFFVNNVFSPDVWGLRTILDQPTLDLPNLRYYFFIYGSYLSYIIFGVILLYKSFSRQPSRFIETPVFTTYLLLCGVIGFMSMYLLPATVGGDRFLAFGWLFGFGPLALAIIEFENRLVKGFSVLVVAAFIFINLFTIHPTIWNPEAEGVGGAATKQDFALARTVDFSLGDVIGYQNDIMTVYEVQTIEGTDAYFLLDPVELDNYDWIIINRAGLEEEGLYSEYTRETIDRMASLESGDSPEYNLIYESNNVIVLEQR